MEEPTKPIFKKCQLSETSGSKKQAWRSLKQILAVEKSLPWNLNDVNYSTCNAPPSFRPAKKYSDISGLIANYTDPQSKLHYHNSEEFTTVRNLPSDLTSGYLGLRAATNIVG